eukprot:TRINITY_DN182_c0_g2_i1.p1 TRINITY_DN182_c0_g2~~TRINITY_DN182_c0_g2_i1.p1  ORF type:complete len:308 (+),score=52.05 TRINITY_DN182_c0_g2_i1:184-1107(+)
MAMQSGIGFSKILFLVGAGYTGTIVLKNGRLSDILGELQSLLKGMDNSGDQSNANSDYSDALAAQVRRLAMEVRQLASARPITVLNGNSSQMGHISSLVVPAAAFGALGYGYMWWKGMSFSDLMYVTKRNMANAVSGMTKHLEHLSDTLAATKRHLTQRIENLDGKLDEQKELSKLIRAEVTDVRDDLSQIGFDLENLQKMVFGLDGKINTLEDKQDFANSGVLYLCKFVTGKEGKFPDFLLGPPEPRNKHAFLEFSGTNSLKGLQQLTEGMQSGNVDKPKLDTIQQNDIDILDNKYRTLTRTAIKC